MHHLNHCSCLLSNIKPNDILIDMNGYLYKPVCYDEVPYGLWRWPAISPWMTILVILCFSRYEGHPENVNFAHWTELSVSALPYCKIALLHQHHWLIGYCIFPILLGPIENVREFISRRYACKVWVLHVFFGCESILPLSLNFL